MDMETRRIDTRIPEDAYRRLKAYKAYKGLTWTGILVEASEELPEGTLEVEQ